MKTCINCGSTKTNKNMKGYNQWYKGNCRKCYDKLFHNPKQKVLRRSRRFKFKDKRIESKYDIRIGVCSLCNKKIGDQYITKRNKINIVKRTHLHHIEYDPNNPIKHTVELCASCHATETLKNRNNYI